MADEFRHVCKTFGRPGLVDLNFNVEPGETGGVVGRGGAGKIRDRVIVAHESIGGMPEAKTPPRSPRISYEMRPQKALIFWEFLFGAKKYISIPEY